MKKLSLLILTLAVSSCHQNSRPLHSDNISINTNDISKKPIHNIVNSATCSPKEHVVQKSKKMNHKTTHHHVQKKHKPQTTTLTIVLTPKEKKHILKNAKKHKTSVDQYVKKAVKAYSKKELKN